MTSACRDFRALLAHALRGPVGSAGTTELSWHEHLLGCEPCRALLEAEEALELLLASLPAPSLPADLAERVLRALAAARDADPLDDLLELECTPAPPGDLGARVLAGVASARSEARLDALLEAVPSPGVPRGLAHDVLAALEPHRRRPRLTLLRSGPLALAAAAVVLVALGMWWWKGGADEPEPTVVGVDPVEPAPRIGETGPDEPDAPHGPVAPYVSPPQLVEDIPAPAPRVPAPAPAPDGTQAPLEAAIEPSDELLASLDVLEYWDLLQDDDVDALLGGLDSLDETLLDYGEEEG